MWLYIWSQLIQGIWCHVSFECCVQFGMSPWSRFFVCSCLFACFLWFDMYCTDHAAGTQRRPHEQPFRQNRLHTANLFLNHIHTSVSWNRYRHHFWEADGKKCLLIVKPNELTPGMPSEEYERRRKALMDSLPTDSIVVSVAAPIKYMSNSESKAYGMSPTSDV